MADQMVQPKLTVNGGGEIEIGLIRKQVSPWGGLALFGAGDEKDKSRPCPAKPRLSKFEWSKLNCRIRDEDLYRFARDQKAWLKTFLALPGGVPSADTFNWIFLLLDTKAFDLLQLSAL